MKTKALNVSIAKSVFLRLEELSKGLTDASFSNLIRHSWWFAYVLVNCRKECEDGILLMRSKDNMSVEIFFPQNQSYRGKSREITHGESDASHVLWKIRYSDEDEIRLATLCTYFGNVTKKFAVGIALGVYEQVLAYTLEGFIPYYDTHKEIIRLLGVTASPIGIEGSHRNAKAHDKNSDSARTPLSAICYAEAGPKIRRVIITTESFGIVERHTTRQLAESLRINARRGVHTDYLCKNDSDIEALIFAIRDNVVLSDIPASKHVDWYQSPLFDYVRFAVRDADTVGIMPMWLWEKEGDDHKPQLIAWFLNNENGHFLYGVAFNDSGILQNELRKLNNTTFTRLRFYKRFGKIKDDFANELGSVREKPLRVKPSNFSNL